VSSEHTGDFLLGWTAAGVTDISGKEPVSRRARIQKKEQGDCSCWASEDRANVPILTVNLHTRGDVVVLRDAKAAKFVNIAYRAVPPSGRRKVKMSWRIFLHSMVSTKGLLIATISRKLLSPSRPRHAYSDAWIEYPCVEWMT